MNWNDIRRIDDAAQNVAKFVFTKDDAVAEAVLYKYPDYATRTVICCSTQSGCPIGCRFCGAGDNFVRSLTASEIVSEVVHCIEQTGIDASSIDRLQIMFMSMGEPMLNLKQLIPAMEELNVLYPGAALLISTSAPRVDYEPLMEVSKRIDKIGLQFSVHESTDVRRDQLIPFKSKLTLAEIVEVGERWSRETGRAPFFNYCAGSENSSQKDIVRLSGLFNPTIWQATVSVICERNDGMPATSAYQEELATTFADRLMMEGFSTRVFNPAGQDTIGGGCGQLWFVQDWMKNPGLAKPSVGRSLPVIHVPSK